MKKFLKFGLVIGMLLLSFGTYAAEVVNISLSVVKNQTKTVSFRLENADDVRVVLKNENGVPVYSENVATKNGKLNRQYDLNYLPNGVYSLNVETETKIVSYKIALAENTTVNKVASEIYKPIVFSKDDKVMLQLLNLEKSPVQVAIYDVNDNLLFTQKFEGELNFSKQFALKKAFSSNYTFVIKYDDMTFTKDIAL
ncbi:hypothetical protein [Neptunitalea lumnitzerae]|uniref:Por secretion system C-terminal sorting domain-containing protein n=1 Tax=Neptunitalea lumnitzerae TaxID=2965509 RepID=A0ABQ5MJP8_9FLAO|nr:hypothetical protein [Neptunitalea sp. Y10]GLB49641.1 hypothetical protein Y10_20090 [Neptunitalea sp. Y10]